MIQHIWTIPCRQVVNDRDSNNVSLIEVLEEITLPVVLPPQPQLGLVPAFFYVVTMWSRQDDEKPVEATGKLSIVSPSGEVVLEHEYPIDLREHKRLRSAAVLFGFPARQAGRYHLRTDYRLRSGEEWRPGGAYPVQVNMPADVSSTTTSPQNGAP